MKKVIVTSSPFKQPNKTCPISYWFMFINRDLSYPYLTSASDLSGRFSWKRLCINVLFGYIARKIKQVFS